mmetsp:Transcript_106351/g.297745  ORF Transcript_106351/g.297745 Transcript_106351/m.297745 type:complete len:85 (-) Transcript_106351:602-856(-)
MIPPDSSKFGLFGMRIDLLKDCMERRNSSSECCLGIIIIIIFSFFIISNFHIVFSGGFFEKFQLDFDALCTNSIDPFLFGPLLS